MKIVAATLGINDPTIKDDDMCEYAHWNAEMFQKNTGITPFVLEDGLVKYGIQNDCFFNKVTSIKFLLYDIFPEADRIIYFDSDMRFVRKFNLFDYIPNQPGFYAVKEKQEAQHLVNEYSLINAYFNNGFFVIDKKYKDLLKYCYDHFHDYKSKWYDQCIMNQVFNGHVSFVNERLNQRELGHYPNSEILGYHCGHNYGIFKGFYKEVDWNA